MIDAELMQLAVLHLLATQRNHNGLINDIRAEWMDQTLHAVELERRRPLWNAFMNDVNAVTGRRNGGVR